MTQPDSLEVVRGDVRLAVTVIGPADRPAITFGHSLAADNSMWSPQVKAFGDDYRLILIDFRGHGASSVPPGPYRIEDFAEDICAVWDRLEIASSSYVGVSLGGAAGIALALAAPERVKGLLVSSCSLQATPPYVAIWQERAKLLEQGGMAEMAEHMMPRWLSEECVARDPEMATRLRQGIEQTSEAGWRATVAALCAMSFQERLPEVAVPLVLTCGTADPVQAMMAGYPGLVSDARYVEIAGGHHILNLDKPEPFNELVSQVVGQSQR